MNHKNLPNTKDNAVQGRVFNIQHFSVNDGPGIRTVVFLKGCPLHCLWCGNPESQAAAPQVAWSEEKCLHCQNCVHQCSGKLYFDTNNVLITKNFHLNISQINKYKLEAINDICPSGAMHVIGELKSVAEVMSEVIKDIIFYQNSQGGMTLSGGEPLMQPHFTNQLLKAAHDEGINCAIETTGFADWQTLCTVADKLDYIFFDIKHMNSQKHLAQTGVRNELILENFRKLVQTYPEKIIHVRTPVIPDFNDSVKDISDILDFLAKFPKANIRYELLRYHRFGIGKYKSLGRIYNMPDKEISDETMATLNALVEKRTAKNT